MNLPISGVTAILVFFLLKLPVPNGTVKEKLAKIDWGYVYACYLQILTVLTPFSVETHW